MVQPHHNPMAHKDLPSVAFFGFVGQMYYRGTQMVRTSIYKVHITLRYLLLTKPKHCFHRVHIQHNSTVYNLKNRQSQLQSGVSQKRQYIQ